MNFLNKLKYIGMFSGLSLSINLDGQVGSAVDTDHYCNKAHSAQRLFNPMLRTNPLTEAYDLKYYKFEWEIDPAVYQIKGTVTPHFLVENDGFEEINFDFSSDLTIDSIMYHGTKLNFTQPSSYLLTIILPSTLSKGTLDSLSISYHGAPPSGGFGSFIQSTHGSQPILWTLSEPFGAQDWWPCKNGLNDKIDSIDVIITTPSKFRAASNGLLVGESAVSNDKKSYHWKHRYPITPYLVAFAVTNYKVYTDDVKLSDGSIMPMLNYVYPESEANAKIGTANNVRVLQYFDSLFIDYPFKKEKYGHAQFGWGGGMEHQTMSFVVDFSWGLLAHELAHQWFGDMVTCGQWEDIWLNEGFATYLEGLSRERFPQANNDWNIWKSGKISSIVTYPGGSVKVDDPSNVNRIFSGRLTYNKGSYLLHMLRWKLGDEAFFSGVRNYLHARSFNYAFTDQLKFHLEAVSGVNLSEYFSDWFEGQGFPNYNIKWDQEGSVARVKLLQTPSHVSVDFFEMPVEIRFKGEGKEKVVRLEHHFSGEEFDIELDFDIESVQFDPNLWLAAKSNVIKDDLILSSSEDEILSTLEIFPNPVKNTLTIIQGDYQKSNYRILDLNGVLIKSDNISSKMTTLDVSSLNAGTYFIQLVQKDNVSVSKFIKVE